MVQTVTEPAFTGSAAEQTLARELTQVMRFAGRMYGTNIAIRQPLAALVEYAVSRGFATGSDAAAIVETAVHANPAIFAVEIEEGVTYVVTTKDGTTPHLVAEGMSHQFRTRLTEPEPTRAAIETPHVRAEREQINENWYKEIIVPEGATEGETDEEDETGEEAAAPFAEIAALAAAHQSAVVDGPLDSAVSPLEEAAEIAAEEAEVVEAAADPTTPAGNLAAALAADGRFVSFGPEYYLRDLLTSFGRNDSRRIREYLVERGEPLSDVDILLDVRNMRRSDPDFETARFSLNAHLIGESDFAFVGTAERRLWSVEGLLTLGTDRRKPADLGTDYRVLLEYPTEAETPADEVAGELDYVEHTLTYYEYEYGVLPLDGELAQFFPTPYLPGQRAAVVTFEAPQHYQTFNVEIRFPTGNRGGFLSGFSAFFHETLVPGALFTIERGDTAGTFRIQYLQVSGQERKLLSLDEKKGRFAFKPATFYCATRESMLLSDNRLPRMAQLKPLDTKERRSLPRVVAAAFERVGENVGDGQTAPRYLAEFDDLYAVANIERPVSPAALRSILTSDANGFMEEDELYYYTPNQ